ncbi:type II toxin-antitoxin system VapC family toxin [Parapedobacter flavus]|uniref:type II toxin-antitoxin system VapC family toxin n=1 Tax=Parapedobacter flavus TaxID=3110225 RepID=UPI002DB59832|nr:type II toxin-antitoxin system VapC family toxin [Parapedobacter sp. 10938]MEC3879737.1 type II toxin-antitoxin system VapC family toxin [Parapedobacter sp. 10938]
MEILLDTQILIWFQLNHPNLKDATTELITDRKNTIYVSDISLYEITIKQTIGKLSDFAIDISDIITVGKEDGFNFIPLSHETIATYADVPLHDNHRDPFDRMIIATAKAHGLAIVSTDEKFEWYRHYVPIIQTSSPRI